MRIKPGRCVLAIESLCWVHRHAPGGSHCIGISDANTHSLFDAAREKKRKIAPSRRRRKTHEIQSLCKHFRASSSFGPTDYRAFSRDGSNMYTIYTHRDEVSFLSLRAAMVIRYSSQIICVLFRNSWTS